MNTFRALTQTIEGWRRKRRQECDRFLDSSQVSLKEHERTANAATTAALSKGKMAQPHCLKSRWVDPNLVSKGSSPLLFTLAVVSLTSVIGYRFYNQPQLAVGTQSPQTIRAPHDLQVEDPRATEQKRRAARTEIAPILKRDPTLTAQIQRELDISLEKLEQLRQRAGRFPFVDEQMLSEGVQDYLRRMPAQEWDALLATLNQPPHLEPLQAGRWQADANFRQAIAQLRIQQETLAMLEFGQLLEQIAQARQQYAQARESFSEVPIAGLTEADKLELLQFSEATWQDTQQGIRRTARQTLALGISPGLPTEVLEQGIKLQLKVQVPREAERLSTQLLLTVLQANLSVDEEQTQHRAEQVASAIAPVVIEARRGEAIVFAGETITHSDFILLDAYGLSRRGINWWGLIGCGSVVTVAIGVFWGLQRRIQPRLRRRDYILLLLLSLSTPILVVVGVPYTNLAAVGLLVSSFYGPAISVTLLSGLGAVSLVGMGGAAISWECAITGAVGGLLAAGLAGRLRSREELALLGGAIGLAQGGAYLLSSVILGSTAGALWYTVLPEAVVYGLSGLAWSVVALGISPYLERLFDLVTPIRLAELSNPNRPLLQRLAIETPGTFQHTLFVASLAEAAARELRCNVELVRAGTLYHDIGKMHDPLGFIENQMGCRNKHDQIDDPYRSAEIIKKHVSEGLVMARKHGLPKAVQDFIPEHQGTLLISYFYFQAQQKAQQAGEAPVREEDFRYDGPIPQSRETGIVMLADGCEAALRSLKDVTPEKALSIVNKILRARWHDGQLAESGLKREELPIIAEVFVRVWQQSNHQRIVYPKAALEPKQQLKSAVGGDQ